MVDEGCGSQQIRAGRERGDVLMDYSREAYEAVQAGRGDAVSDEDAYSWSKCQVCGREYLGPKWWSQKKLRDGKCEECVEGLNANA